MNAILTHRLLFSGLLICLLVAVLISILSGSIEITVKESLDILQHRLGTGTWGADAQQMAVKESVLLQIRLPRIVLALLTGLTLAVSGAVMQGLFRNPLADPGLMGISAGCAFGAALFAVLGANWLAGMGTFSTGWALPIAAFLGGLA